MARIGRFLVVVVLAGALLPLGSSAASGGGSWLEFDRRYLVPGEQVTGRAEVWVGEEGARKALELGAPQAYLAPDLRRRISGDAVALGDIELRRRGRRTLTAMLSFIVPEVAPGDYYIQYCVDPCRRTMTLGDLIGGSISIAPTRELADLWAVRDRLRERQRVLSHQVRRLERRVSGLRERTAAGEEQNEDLEARLGGLEARLAAAEAEPEAPAAPWAIAGGLAVVALWLWRARRRRSGTSAGARTPPRPERFVAMKGIESEVAPEARSEEPAGVD